MRGELLLHIGEMRTRSAALVTHRDDPLTRWPPFLESPMKHSFPAWRPVLMALTLLGCARTSIDSLIAPEMRPGEYHRILVAALLSDIGLQREMEERFGNSYH